MHAAVLSAKASVFASLYVSVGYYMVRCFCCLLLLLPDIDDYDVAVDAD